MIVSTMNPGGRRIDRANHPTNEFSWAYTFAHTRGPGIVARIEGSDGKSYAVTLSAADLTAIDNARERYAEHFPPTLAASLAAYVSDDDAPLDRRTFLTYVRDRIDDDLKAAVDPALAKLPKLRKDVP